MNVLHYIADDLGIQRDYKGGERLNTVTEASWRDIEEALLEVEAQWRLTAERIMDEIEDAA